MKSLSFKKIILSIIFSSLAFCVFALDATPRTSFTYWPEVLLKTPSQPENITWTQDGRYYILSSGDKLYIGLASRPELPNSVTSGSGKLIFLDSKHQILPDLTTKDFILSISEKNYVAKVGLPKLETTAERSMDKNRKVLAADFASNTNLAAVGLNNGDIILLRHLTGIKDFMEDGALKGHVKPVHSLAFSHDSEFLASASEDGAVFVWKVSDNNSLAYQLTGGKNVKLPVVWANDSKRLIIAESTKKLVVKNFQNVVLQTITLNAPIRDYSLTPDGKQILTLGTDNVIYVYDFLTGRYSGFIPAFNKTDIVSFAVTPDEEKIMVGHKDGTVFLMELDQVYMAPNTSGSTGRYTKNPNGIKDSDTPSSAAAANENATGFGKHRNPNAIEIRADFNLHQSPYLFGGGLEIGYTNAGLLQPFYFGGLFKLDLGLPQPDFPYQYRDANGNVIPAPDLAGASFVVPVGYSFFPTSGDFEIFSEIQGGVVVHTLYLPGVGVNQFAVGGTVGLTTGVAWKRLALYIGGNFDFVAGFLFTGGLAYRIEF